MVPFSSLLNRTKEISGYQFATFRILFGIYLLLHFIGLLPFGQELFSNTGVLPDASLNPIYGIFPNILAILDSPGAVTGLLVMSTLLSVLYTCGILRRTSALLLWYCWACLFNRNTLISNPSIPYVGLVLLFSALLPPGEPLRLHRAGPDARFFWPAGIYWSAWFLLAAGYTYSGIVKLSSPSWVDGTALVHLVNNPLARPGIFRDLFLLLPAWIHHAMTWSVLALEVLFLPLSVHRWTRAGVWCGMLAMHLGILLMVNFADLSFGMVLIHLFTFDPDWLPIVHTSGRRIVFYDGVCGLCDRTVQFLVGIDTHDVLHFAQLQGETAKRYVPEDGPSPIDKKSVIYVRENGATVVSYRSDAILSILSDLGGFWRLVSFARIVPRSLRHAVYNWIARNRYRWFGKYDACRIPGPEERKKFLAD